MSLKTIGILAGTLVIGGIVVGTFMSYANKGNRLENGIKAQYEQNQNTLTAMSNTVMDMAQVPAMARDDLTKVIKAAMEGRYGNDKTLLAKSVTEAYPGTLDAALYTRIQNAIESGRRDFAAEQAKLIDKTRLYQTALGEMPGSFILSIVGYPRINFDDYKIVVSDYTADAFKSKRDNGLKLGN